MRDDRALREEEANIRRLRLLVDVTAQVLAEDTNLTFCEALRLIDAAGTAALRIFPERHQTFDLVTRPRLERIVQERFGLTSLVPVN
jgi:hypothetical protein